MTMLIVLTLLSLFLLVPIKIGTQVLQIERADIGYCIVATLSAITASFLSEVMIGQGLFPSMVTLLITSIFFAMIFRTTAVVGFILALISIGVQFLFTIVLVALGFAVAFGLA